MQIGGMKKKIYRDANMLNALIASFASDHNSSSLDIGSGPVPRNPFGSDTVSGTDLRENKRNNVLLADFCSGILPFDNETFDYVTAYDVLEHIQRVVIINGKTHFPFVILMNEIFRVLKTGGLFFSIQPCFPAKEVFQDPTHVNIMTEDTMYQYFCEPTWARIYGYEGSFEMIKDGWIEDKYFSFIKKSSAYPVKNIEFVQK